MTDRLALGNRMKIYERNSNQTLTKRVPVIIRIDGRAFHRLTKKVCTKGFDIIFHRFMSEIMKTIAHDMQGCSFAYGQSDEMSFLLTDYRTINTECWFGYELNKLTSISASLASSLFTDTFKVKCSFDSRAFNLPQDEVCNYFIWRQQDATRNAIQMLGQEHFSHKELFKKTCNDIQDMVWKKTNINFNDLPSLQKRGYCVVNGEVDQNIPIFTQDRNYVEKFVNVRED